MADNNTNRNLNQGPDNIAGSDNPNSMAKLFSVSKAEEKGGQYLLTIKNTQNGKEEQVRIAK